MATSYSGYRDSKKPRAVCVYTIAQESRYVIIENVPNLGITQQLLDYCQQYGQVEEYRLLDEHPSSTEYSDVYLIQFATIKSARFAKRKMDDRPFYTQLLKVNYAPEYETFQDIRVKFEDRYRAITFNKKKRRHHPSKSFKSSNVISPPTPLPPPSVTVVTSHTAAITTPKKRRRI
ncbi:MAG: hypothetical protein EXX96DRAFT_360067 [Benjaminiella poitrasii]|nr:MAG: hypothetical protein EXX96DRAFT_360067 [Benjaminiella poitrasii]